MEMIEHPDINHIMRTGEPYGVPEPKKHYCQECGADLSGKKVYYDEYCNWLCAECLLFFHEKRWNG